MQNKTILFIKTKASDSNLRENEQIAIYSLKSNLQKL